MNSKVACYWAFLVYPHMVVDLNVAISFQNVYFDNQLKTGKDRVVSSSAFALSTVGILLSAFGLRQMGHNQKWIERGWRHWHDSSLNNFPSPPLGDAALPLHVASTVELSMNYYAIISLTVKDFLCSLL